MNISFIVAMDKNRVIDKDNDIPWRLPKDWQYVKKTTMGHPIILGRKNFESIGRVLPGRRNIVLTRDTGFTFEGCEIAHSIEDVFELCKNEEEIFIFGGEQIYKLFLPYVNKMYITRIHHEFEGDTFFLEVHFDEWKEGSVEKGITDDKNPYVYYFHVYERKA
jgi:dihydrofolate reductase (trimethoprim resistance protein)